MEIKQFTAEGYEVQVGDSVWVARQVPLPGHILRKAKPTEENPDATEDTYIPGKKHWKPDIEIVTEEAVGLCWRRYYECFTYCESLNRSKETLQI